MHKQMFKVMCPIEKKDGTGTYWGRAGVGYRNKDESINLYLDFLPINGKLQLREEEFKPRYSGSETRAPAASQPAFEMDGTIQ